jgi:ubiquinone/menaquinone biosynthesis C-methylase UbiE
MKNDQRVKKLLVTLLILVPGQLFCEKTEPTSSTSGWWEFCLGNTVSYTTFEGWLGGLNAPSRRAMRNHVKEAGYTSILDVPCGLCIDYMGLKNDKMNIAYYGADFTQKLIERAQKLGLAVRKADIEELPYSNNQFDVAYARHILEHLSSYKKAVAELIRVARYEVLIVFFIKPSDIENDVINCATLSDHKIYHNTYNKKNFEAYVLACPKVKSVSWENIGEQEQIAHIYLKTSLLSRLMNIFYSPKS